MTSSRWPLPGTPLLGTLLLGATLGCTTRAPLAVQRFTLDAPTGPIPASAPGARLYALPSVRMNPVLLEPSIVYRIGGDRIELDPYASLAAPPRSLLTAVIREYLLREPFVQEVVPGLAGPSGFTVDIYVQEMTGDFSRPGEATGALALEVAVYRGDEVPGAVPILRKVYSRREPLPQRTAAAVVASWNRGLAAVMRELGADLAAIPDPGKGGPGGTAAR